MAISQMQQSAGILSYLQEFANGILFRCQPKVEMSYSYQDRNVRF
jgi:hypothetical protein